MYAQAISDGNDSALHTAFSECIPTITQQRIAVEKYVSQGNSVYGFSTLLGHLDHVAGGDDSQKKLIDGHLVGSQSPMSPRRFRTVSYVKLAQLSLGGSGISPETFKTILSRASTWDAPAVGNWTGSYSSGDVVQGAWWAHNIIGDTIKRGGIPAGDVIALINGDFFSTGVALDVSMRLRGLFMQTLKVACLLGSSERLSNGVALNNSDHYTVTRKTALWPHGVQPPVSLRDITPLVELIKNSYGSLMDTINSSIERPSGNPLFSFTNKTVQHHSQSSFLNFDLSQALLGATDAVQKVSSHIQRYIQHYCAMAADQIEDQDSVVFVQPPKVAAGILARIYGVNAQGTIPVLAESHGIEDVCDESLRRADALEQAIDHAMELIKIFDDCVDQAQRRGISDKMHQAAGLSIEESDRLFNQLESLVFDSPRR